MIHKSNPYNVKPLPKLKYFSLGKFGKKPSARHIVRQKELKRKPEEVKIIEKKIGKNVFCWGNKSGEFKVLERKANFGPRRGTEIKIKKGW